MSPKGRKKTCNLLALPGEASQQAESSANVALLKDFSCPSEGFFFPAHPEVLSLDLRAFLGALCFIWPKKIAFSIIFQPFCKCGAALEMRRILEWFG